MGQLFLSVVVPAYNEESRIALTLEQLSTYLGRQEYSWEIIVADDGSMDATANIVSDWASSNGLIRLVRLDHRGKGWAVQQGMLAARGEYRFLCDADLSMPVEQIDRFVAQAGDSPDIVLGSRELPDSRRIGEPARRHLMGRVFNLIIRVLAVPGIRDTQCGFKLFKAETTAPLFETQVLEGFAFDVEILCLARVLGLDIREIAIDWHYREGSKVRPVRDSFRMVRDVLRVRSRLKTRT
ncbi:MAG: glycosyltransferase family 2 protein [Chloroflexi bacterium]|nr:glycosyltransferase family 2 protein [Chloroflexota bacterium]